MAIPTTSDKPVDGLQKQASRTKVSDLPGSLPKTQVPADVDVEGVSQSFLPHLLSLAPEHLTGSAIWRDSLALTGTFRTFYSAERIVEAWKNTFNDPGATDLILVPSTARLFRLFDESSWIEADITFNVRRGGLQQSCSGIISIAFDESNEWKIWMIRTTLEGIEGYGNVDALDPVKPREVVEETTINVNGRASNGQQKHENTQHFDVVVVGGGQAGLGVGGRLQALDVSYVVIDKFKTVGDSWNSRYDSTKRELALLSCHRLNTNTTAVHTAREYGESGILCGDHRFNMNFRALTIFSDIRQFIPRVSDERRHRKRSPGICKKIWHCKSL